MQTVWFRPSEDFKELADTVFEQERIKIVEKIPGAEVHHIAGTSIPGLLTKGDLDINIRVQQNHFNDAVTTLKEMYDINQPENWTSNYASFKNDTGLGIDFGAQLSAIDTSGDYFLKPRDLLLKNPELVKELNELKTKYEGKSMDDYRREKGAFFQRLIKS